MTARTVRRVGLLIVALSCGRLVGQESADDPWPRPVEGCVGCHSLFPVPEVARPIAQVGGDVHGGSGVGCADCHGGDPEIVSPMEMAHDPDKGFRPVAELRAAILDACGRCHPGPRDALLAGPHAPGEAAVPDCVDCHYEDHLTRRSLDAIATRTHCGECHEAGPVLAFRSIFERAGPALDAAVRLSSDPFARREARDRSGLLGDVFEADADRLAMARMRFRVLSHGVAAEPMEEAADEILAASEAIDGRPRPPRSEKTGEVLLVYAAAGLIVLIALVYLTTVRRL